MRTQWEPMEPNVLLYPAIEAAIRDGAILLAAPGAGKEAYGREVELVEGPGHGNEWRSLTLAVGPTLPDALHMAEQDLLGEHAAAAAVNACACRVCALNRLFPAAPAATEPTSPLDRLILMGNRFGVKRVNDWVQLKATWKRNAHRLTRPLKEELQHDGAVIRFRHGEYVWESYSSRGKKTGKWLYGTRYISHPPAANGNSRKNRGKSKSRPIPWPAFSARPTKPLPQHSLKTTPGSR